MSAYRRIGVIGRGAVGFSLSAQLKASGFLASLVPGSTLESEIDSLRSCDLIFICVPDDAVASVVGILQNCDINLQRKLISHCSGLLNSSILGPLSEKGALIGSSHPIQTFNKQKLENFEGIFVTLEGDQDAVKALDEIFEKLGSKTLFIEPQHKAVVHLAAVFASNFMISLGSVSQHILDRVGMSQNAVRLFEPLMQTTLKNMLSMELPDALSGPVKRGDKTTIELHKNWLKKQLPQYETMYQTLTDELFRVLNE